jgi:hypothetical protein
MITVTPGFIDSEPVDDLLNIEASCLPYALVNAIKELNARIELLERRAT